MSKLLHYILMQILLQIALSKRLQTFYLLDTTNCMKCPNYMQIDTAAQDTSQAKEPSVIFLIFLIWRLMRVDNTNKAQSEYHRLKSNKRKKGDIGQKMALL